MRAYSRKKNILEQAGGGLLTLKQIRIKATMLFSINKDGLIYELTILDSSLPVAVPADASNLSVRSRNVEVIRDISRYLIQEHGTDTYIGRILRNNPN